ncbi:MAG: hypothetical protein COX77_02870 [Candidatus Komeilibacteria bacterium CG_4_10_14_0_2_um_filter_37_10]|uniref:Zinc finger DksA/TraR C4-type domain-containing protein n=1 Tax=Candidatus Komeilibacteria bacterium CG_4_10_14_0_2_um_filter_37_10 TaxID=1974470 RepID=A0A2M7VF12_9BACT|nr:MAG: hypothetical protein COX77_02870 [Candidatus Komeilibacteria bacterium CG_4_10_14_0_2_um_filter_37_10]
MPSTDFIKKQQEILEKKKQDIERQLGGLVEKDRQGSQFDAKFPDFGDTEDDNAAEVAVYEGNLSLEEDLKFSLERIKVSLQKIANNTYGVCDKCGSEILTKRLEVFPQANSCMNCKAKRLD